MRGLIVINGYPYAAKFLEQGGRIGKALRDEGIGADLVLNGEVIACINEQGRIEGVQPKRYDFVVYLDKDKYLGRMLEDEGLRLFNSAKAVEVCDDKLSTYLALGDCGLRLAASIPAPLCYTKDANIHTLFLEQVAKRLQFPLVAKKSYGSFGAGVRLINDMTDLEEVETEWLHEPHFYQQYVRESKGKDYRIIVIGGKAIGCMERQAKGGEFRSNIELGGVGKTADPPKVYWQAAELAAQTLGLDYCGVDLLETEAGPVLCEVNSNAFFDGFEKATGLDVAALYAKHIVKALQDEKIIRETL